jgi:hypothetical protein
MKPCTISVDEYAVDLPATEKVDAETTDVEMTDTEVVDKAVDVSAGDESAFDIVSSILAEIVADATRPSEDEFFASIIMDMVRNLTQKIASLALRKTLNLT